MATKKEQRQCLLWRRNRQTYEKDGFVFYYDDINEVSKAFENYDVHSNLYEFLEALANGNIKHGLVGKNINTSREHPQYASLAEGDYFVEDMATKDSVYDHFLIMDDTALNYTYSRRVYHKVESVRDLTDEETSIIKQLAHEALHEQDKLRVFNLFCVLCCAKKVWDTTDTSRINNGSYCSSDKCFLYFDTYDLFTDDEVEARKIQLSTVAHEAYKLTRALTGCDLVIKGKEPLDFVSCLMNSRYLEPDQVDIVRGMPTITLKEVFDRVVDGKDRGDELDSAIKTCLDKIIVSTNMKHSNLRGIFMDDCVSAKGIKAIEEQQMAVEDFYPEDFRGIDKCIVWKNTLETCAVWKLYLWDEALTTYDLVGGDLKTFIKVMNNK